MKKKRIAVYLALVLAFALACSAHLIPKLTVRAYDYDPAEIGTATLADEGDTVFIRMGKFTFGEGDEAEEIVAPGFVVADAATGENPAAGIDLTAITPITPEAPLTGTLDKNIYVCGGIPTDLYLGDLTLAEGRRLYTDGASLNLLGGKLEAPAIETAGFISVGSADVTVNSDLTGFSGITVFVSRSGGGDLKGFNTPASLTVNGDVTNTGSYRGAAIGVSNGCSMTVTGSVSTRADVTIHSATSLNENMGSLTVGGSLTVSDGQFALVHSHAEIGGSVNTKGQTHLIKGSDLTVAGSLTASTFGVLNDSYFEIGSDVTLSAYLDLSENTNAHAYSIGGDLSCGQLHIKGASKEKPVSLDVNNVLVNGPFFTQNAVLDIDGALTTGSFTIQNSKATVSGDATCGRIDMYLSEVEIGGSLDASSGDEAAIRGSTLTVGGDMKCKSFNMLGSTATVGGDLKTASYFTLVNGLPVGVNKGSSLKVTGDVSHSGNIDLCSGSELQTDGALNASGAVQLSQNCALDVKKDLTGSTFSAHRSQAQVGGSLTASSGFVGVHSGSALTVDGDLKANVLWPHAPCEVKGNVTVSAPVSLDKALKVGGDFDCSGYWFDVTGSKCEIGGDLKNVGQFDATYGADVKIGGSVLCDGANGDGLFTVVDSACEIGGDLQARTSLQSGKYNRGSALTVGGSATAGTWVHVAENCTADVAGDVTWNYGIQNLAGTLTVGGDFVNNAHSSGFQTWDGYFVSGLLDVAGDVRMNDVLLNYNDYEQNLAIGGRIIANRKADVLMTIPNSVYVIEGRSFTTDEDEDSTMYSVPFYSQTAALTINGEPYAMDVRDLGRKAYVPVRVSPANAVTYELNGGAFKADAVIENSYYTEIGIDLPAENDVEKRVGLLFGGWYDNADFAGTPITAIPEGTTGDVTVYLKWIECDHAASTAQPTCTEGAVCTVCGKEIPAAHDIVEHAAQAPTCTQVGWNAYETCTRCDYSTYEELPATGHVYDAPEWQWEDEAHAVAVFRCTCGDSEITAPANAIDSEQLKAPTKRKDGVTRYTASVQFEGKTYTGTYDQTIPALGLTKCPICGKTHGDGFLDTMLFLIHSVLYFYRSLGTDLISLI